MAKRARYDGPQEEVRVEVDAGNIYSKFVSVKRGGLLPTETDDGDSVPASVRDDLIKNNPDFSEVQDSSGSSSSSSKDKEAGS